LQASTICAKYIYVASADMGVELAAQKRSTSTASTVIDGYFRERPQTGLQSTVSFR
jgi:hypothetical protein